MDNRNNRKRGSSSSVAAASTSTTVSVKLRSSDARLPVRGTPSSAGLDLFCAEPVTLPPFHPDTGLTPIRLPLHISLALPAETYGRLTGRSSTTMRGLLVLDGVVDADYRGPVDLMAVNLTSRPISVQTGDRVGQLILERCRIARVRVVPITGELDDTVRGKKGFGSTGK